MRTTLDIPDDLFRQLKAESALRGLTLKEFLSQLLRASLTRRSAPGERAARSPLPVFRPPTGSIHPSLSNREIEQLFTTEDAAHGQH